MIQDGEDRRARDGGKGGRLDRCQLERPIQTCRVQDVRRALVLFTSIPTHGGEWARASPTQVLIAFAESQRRCVTRLGLVQSTPWTRSTDSARRYRSSSSCGHALFSVCGYALVNVIGPQDRRQNWRGQRHTPWKNGRRPHRQGNLVHEGMSGFDSSFIWWWTSGRLQDSRDCQTPVTH